MLNIVIPMAGRGSRFERAGYPQPKPLIPVHGIPMIEVVIDNLRPSLEHRFIFVCQASHLQRYELRRTLNQAAPGCEIMPIDGVTAGAACTVLLTSEWIDNDDPLMIANCDQWIDYPIDRYLAAGMDSNADGFLMTMTDDADKWSYVDRDQNGQIRGIVEKVVVSDEATVGIYNFRRGGDFVHSAMEMIQADERSKGEFYVAPVYSRMIAKGARVTTHSVGDAGSKMHGLGTPDDLETFLKAGYKSRIAASVLGMRKSA